MLLLLAALCLGLSCISGAAAAAPREPAAVTADGGAYYGTLRNGRLHGIGRIEWPNGTFYDGEFENGLFEGRGVWKTGPGNVYSGTFRKGMMSGRGRMRHLDGSVYVGAFRDDAFHGEGRYEDSSGEVYEGTFHKGTLEGRGRMAGPDGRYEGEFRNWHYWGHGEIVYGDGRKYRGEFVRGRYHGKGRFETPAGDVYEGEFLDGEFSGSGNRKLADGTRHEGRFLKWRAEGPGRSFDASGTVYEGNYVQGELKGQGQLTGKHGARYEGEFDNNRFHGQGTLRLPNGDVYKGGFAHGVFEGQGTLTYARPRPDGTTRVSGVWRYGQLRDDAAELQARINVETALYNQRTLLNEALNALAPRDPAKINMYVLAVAGDASQEVFRREVQFVRGHFDRAYGTEGRSIALINSRNTVSSAPMATVSSIRESLQAIASRMDREHDVLFLFLTSHGSQEHELTLNQNHMGLRGLQATELAKLLAETGIRWKVIVVSACYSGGFIEPLRSEQTVIITAARHDRRSFGCADDNDFTYFGRAYFKEALPHSASFEEAFEKASVLVNQWEADQSQARSSAGDDVYSLPQISAPASAAAHLRRWWNQLTPASSASLETPAHTH